MYLTNHPILSSQNLDELREILAEQLAPHDINITQRGHEVDASVNGCNINDLSLTSLHYGEDVPIKVRVHESQCTDLIALNIITSGKGRLQQNGEEWELSSKRGLVFSLQQPSVTNTQGCHGLILAFSAATLRQHARALIGDSIDRIDFKFDTEIDLTTPAGQALCNAIFHAAEEMNGPLGHLNNPIAMTNLENYLLTQFITLQPNAFTVLPQRSIEPAIMPYHVKRARDYIYAHAHTKITLQDLATHSGCSYRTLQTAFNKAFALSPMTYLNTVRLEYVRAALLDTDPQTASISNIARQWGFVHMGRFGASYKSQYGVTPSETLQLKK